MRFVIANPKEFKQDSSKKLVRDITSFGWGYKGMVKLVSMSNTDHIFALIKQSYEETI